MDTLYKWRSKFAYICYSVEDHPPPPPGLVTTIYKLNVDVASLIEGVRWGIGALVRDVDGVIVAGSCWQVFSLPD